ncbi:MAG: adenylate cyclase [Paracoccaceae bacterium]|jgi:adenylate cyclase
MRQLCAILAADIVGYSRLMGQDEAGTLDALRRFRAELFEPTVAGQRGKIVKSMGDGWLVSFTSTADAAACALHIQDRLALDPLIKMRIGVHIGDVVFEREDMFGDGVNVAARLQEFCDPGCVALSDAAFGSLDGAMAPSFDDGGSQSFKNIQREIRVWLRAAPLPDLLALGEGMVDGRPVLTLQPVITADDRADVQELTHALTSDVMTCLSSVDWLNAETRQDPQMDCYVLGANLRTRGDRMRLEVTLAAPDGTSLWTEKYDGDLNDAFDWQDDTAQDIAIGAVDLVLDRERRRIEAIPLADMTAEDCVIISMMDFALLDQQSMARNLTYLAAAIEKRPDYTEGYAHAIANFIACTSMNMQSALAPHKEAFPKWVDAARTLSGPTATLIVSLGLADYRFDGDQQSLHRAIKDALRLAPFSAVVICNCGFGYVWMGAPEAALDCFRRGEKLIRFNPMAMPMLGGASIACVQAGYDDAAIEYCLRGLETSNGYNALHTSLVAAYGHKGDLEKAAYYLIQLMEIDPSYSIQSRRVNSRYADTPGNRRFEEGLRKAGMAEA